MFDQLEKSRKELLDFSLRNRLINYKNSISRTIEIIDEKSDEIFNILVNDGFSMIFEPSDIDENSENDLDDYYLFTQPKEKVIDQERFTDNILQTKHSDIQLQKRLRSISSFAKSSIEEQGVNILYLALGFLKWYESDDSAVERFAPLILVPVTLQRTSVRSKFKLRYNEEEPGVNISLLEKIKNEQGIKIESLELIQKEDIRSFYLQIKNSIKDLNRWQVIEDDIRLGFFSFNKFLMYNDLNSENWSDDNKPYDHPILAKLLGNGFDSELSLGDDYHGDDISYENIHHVVESDSSQQEVILAIRSGQNMVVQGPPGTGKSQTITNIIADFVARGKKVLFVAEKMAALNVVKNRLDSLDIGDIALELHSNKANKKEFLKELKTTLSLNEPISPFEGNELIKKTDYTRDTLNKYSSAVNTPIGNSGFTPIQVFGYYLKTHDRIGKNNIPDFDLNKIQVGTKEEYSYKLNVVREVSLLLDKTGILSKNPFNGVQNKDFDFYSSKEWNDGVQKLLNKYKDLSLNLMSLLNVWKVFNTNSCLKDLEKLFVAIESLSRKPNIGSVNYEHSYIKQFNKLVELEGVIQGILEFSKQYSKWKDQCFDKIWQEDVLNIRSIILKYNNRWYKNFSPKYRSTINTIKAWTKNSSINHEEALELVDLILLSQETENKWSNYNEVLQEIFGECESAMDIPTSWLEVINWAKEVSILVGNDSYYKSLLNLDKVKSSQVINIKKIIENYKILNNQCIQYLDSVKHDDSFIVSVDTDISIILDKLDSWVSNQEYLQDYIQLLKNIDRLEDNNLDWLKEYINDWKLANSHLVDLFQHIWFTKLSRSAFNEHKILDYFDGKNHHQLIKDYIEQETNLLRYNSYKILDIHYNNMPNNRGINIGNLGILRTEFSKKRKLKPIRKLLNICGEVIQDIKPLFMMSPMSIAQYLPQNSVEFDLVLFDEASQIKPVEGFGAILRGKQVVVVGDSKQLPPTSFFDNEFDADEEDELVDELVKTSDVESILTLFSAKRATEKMLRWHYRSKHESLIAVNNQEFYNSSLFVFPTAYQNDPKRGLQFKYLPYTTYSPGKGGRKNRGEAEAVVEAIIQHTINHPNLTLGIAAFSQTQARLIEDLLEKKLLESDLPKVEEFLYHTHDNEPFFIKNLENVQGDERDVIMISVGYGKQENGKFGINFGPINKDGGERRLNVLFSRAKQQCVIFSNFKADELDLSKTQSIGVKALKTFLQYADNRQLSIPDESGGKADSPFEEQVANVILNHGYEIVQQVGSAGFRIDIGVKHPIDKGRFLLAVECDGASYHSSKIARDRDKTRQLVLEAQGWVFHRIWSTDWFLNPKRETDRLILAIEHHSKKNNNNHKNRNNLKPLSRLEVERDESVREQQISIPYKKSELSLRLLDQLYEFSSSQFADWIQKIVKVEQPVHKDIVLNRILEATSVARKGRRIIQSFENGVAYAVDRLNLTIDQNFLSIDHDILKVRDRSNLNRKEKKINYLPPNEVKKAILIILKNSYGAEFNDIEGEVLNTLGFSKKSTESNELIEKCLNELQSNKKIEIKNNVYLHI